MESDAMNNITLSIISTSTFPKKFRIRAESADKNVWISDELDEQLAQEISNKGFDLNTIEQIMNVIMMNRAKENKIEVNITPIQEDLHVLITIYETFKTRTITLQLEKQRTADPERLQHLLLEANKKIESLQKQIEATQKMLSDQKRLISHISGPLLCTAHGVNTVSQILDACQLFLPDGSWLVEYSFVVRIPTEDYIPYYICQGSNLIKGHLTSRGPHGDVSVSGRLIATSTAPNNRFSLHFRALPTHEYTIENVILSATPMELFVEADQPLMDQSELVSNNKTNSFGHRNNNNNTMRKSK
jgi:hypothetical protein